MKPVLILFIALLTGYAAHAQSPAPIFNPQTMPVAVVSDSTVQLIVSNFTLIRSLKTQVPNLERVEKVAQIKKAGKEYLVFTAQFRGAPRERYFINIPLREQVAGWYYATSGGSVCAGCNDCQGNCGACSDSTQSCSAPPASVHIISTFPLAKVTLSIE